jgi:hypothetical protein
VIQKFVITQTIPRKCRSERILKMVKVEEFVLQVLLTQTINPYRAFLKNSILCASDIKGVRDRDYMYDCTSCRL